MRWEDARPATFIVRDDHKIEFESKKARYEQK
jgi:hypothetical protein